MHIAASLTACCMSVWGMDPPRPDRHVLQRVGIAKYLPHYTTWQDDRDAFFECALNPVPQTPPLQGRGIAPPCWQQLQAPSISTSWSSAHLRPARLPTLLSCSASLL